MTSLIVIKSQTIYNGWPQSSRALTHGTEAYLANSDISFLVFNLAVTTSTILDTTSDVSSNDSLTPNGAFGPNS